MEIHSDAISRGQRVLIVDDVLATGGTARAATNLVARLGGAIHAVAFLIELTFLHGRDKLADVPMFSVLQVLNPRGVTPPSRQRHTARGSLGHAVRASGAVAHGFSAEGGSVTHRSTPRIAQVVALAAALLAAPVAASAATALVVNNRDDGAGSFRAAIESANNNASIDTIQFLFTVGTVRLKSTVDYTGTQALTIHGAGATLDGSKIDDEGALDEFLTGIGAAFRVASGADLAVSNLTVRNAPGEGIALIVPASRLGTVRLVDVQRRGRGEPRPRGAASNDEEDPRTFEDAITGEAEPARPDGSAASVDVTVLGCRFVGNGFGVLDRDGLRVNEGGEGSLRLTVRTALAHGNGADGIEVDERGAGDVHVDVFGAQLTGNGSFTALDFDDGFDIDEYNDGGIFGQVVFSNVSNNWEEGLDFNENNAGDLRVDLLLVEANGNREEAIDYEEDDDFAGDGDLVTTMTGIRANGNGVDDGDGAVKIREKGVGRPQAVLNGIETLANAYDGVNIREDDAGDLQASVSQANSQDNDGDGVSFDERGAGMLHHRNRELDRAWQRRRFRHPSRRQRHARPHDRYVRDQLRAPDDHVDDHP